MKRYILHVVEVVLHLLIIVAVTKFYYQDTVDYHVTEPDQESILTTNLNQGGTSYGF